MSDGQVKKYSASLYVLECPALFDNRTSNSLVYLSAGQVKIFRFFYPCILSWFLSFYTFQGFFSTEFSKSIGLYQLSCSLIRSIT